MIIDKVKAYLQPAEAEELQKLVDFVARKTERTKRRILKENDEEEFLQLTLTSNYIVFDNLRIYLTYQEKWDILSKISYYKVTKRNFNLLAFSNIFIVMAYSSQVNFNDTVKTSSDAT